MDFTDRLWTEKWGRPPFKRIVEGRVPDKGGVGCEGEPASSLWCASLAEAIGERYGEGMRVLDYGCGYGRFFNFLSGRLKSFLYFGLEIPNTPTRHGEGCIDYARSRFSADGRGRFGFSGSDLEKQALEEADVVLLGSVFTHMDFERFQTVFGQLLPVIRRGGAVVFTVLIAEQYTCTGPGFLLEMNDYFYQDVRYTRSQLREYFDGLDLALIEAEYFQAPMEDQPLHSRGGDRQIVFRAQPRDHAPAVRLESQDRLRT